MQSLLDQVNILIHMKVGDPYRLEHIKLMLKQKRTVYGSDRAYLDHLIHDYIEEVKTQKNLAKIRGEDPFEDQPNEKNSDEDEDELVELDHIYCWKCGKSIPVNSKFCLVCGTNIQKSHRKDVSKDDPPNKDDPPVKKEKKKRKEKGSGISATAKILIVILITIILIPIIVYLLIFAFVSEVAPSFNSLKSNAPKCETGTVFDDATNTCLLEGTQTTSKCGAGTVFDDATNTCLLEGTQTTSKCGAGTVFDDATNTCLLK